MKAINARNRTGPMTVTVLDERRGVSVHRYFSWAPCGGCMRWAVTNLNEEVVSKRRELGFMTQAEALDRAKELMGL